MKKFFYLSALSLGMMCSITACSDDDTTTIDAKNLDYTAENASSWGNYMRVVAQLLVNDATALYDDWAVKYNEGGSYADFFKNQDALTSVEQLIDGCVDIANEVGTAKIGDPYDLFIHNNEEKALYAVDCNKTVLTILKSVALFTCTTFTTYDNIGRVAMRTLKLNSQSGA